VKRLVFAACALSISAASLPAAQLYRWVDDKGRVEWRDTPPPPDAKSVEQRKIIANTIDSSTPYALQQAMKKYPVTLWTANCGEACSQAAAHLARRGIPHTVHDAQKDRDALQKATGGREVPVLFVGSQQLKGYLESSWDAALDEAGYPRTPVAGVKAPAASK
jgi:glutaredoxin